MPTEMSKLSDHLGGRDNHLNLIRFLAAFAVLVSHAYPISLGADAAQPLEAQTGKSLGAHAVSVFFVISGLLIARSFERSESLMRFIMARILRLYPALFVVLALTMLAGGFFSQLTLAEYISSPELLSYMPNNLGLAFLQYELPGVFLYNPYGPIINGSLWSLSYEVTCYIILFIVGVFGFLRNKIALFTLFLAIAIAYFNYEWLPSEGILLRLHLLSDLGFSFALGVMAYALRDRLLLDWKIAGLIWAIALAFLDSYFSPRILVIAIAYSIIWIAFVPKGWLIAYNKLGDYSYGIYIYSFPVQQAMVHCFPGSSPWLNVILSLPVALIMGIISWHFIEVRFLAMARPSADWIDQQVARFCRMPSARD